MTYVQGFLVPVPHETRQAYCDMATRAVPLFREYGAFRVAECWGDDLPAGKSTDMARAVKAEPGEAVVFSWIAWPDRATCDAAAERMMTDERMKPDGPMPFDGARMIWGGFDPAFDTGEAGRCGYVDGMVASVPDGDRAAFVAHAEATAALFIEQGALRVFDGWGVDVPGQAHRLSGRGARRRWRDGGVRLDRMAGQDDAGCRHGRADGRRPAARRHAAMERVAGDLWRVRADRR